MATTSRAAIYIRVSTEEQGLRDLSLPFQLETCHRLADLRGWQVVGVYEEVGSAKSDKRENFQRLIADAKGKMFDAVIVYKYSRFARSDVDSLLYERELNKRGVELVSATEPIDSTTSSGWLNKRVLQTFAEYDNRLKAEFVRAGMKEKLVRGEWAWHAPLGYVNKREGIDKRHRHTWVEVDAEKAPLVIRLFEEAASGNKTLFDLCDLAEEIGLKTITGKSYVPHKMVDLLINPFYKGKVVSKKFEVEADGVHEALIDEQLWERVQLKLKIRSKGPYTANNKHILRGLMKCACGMAMTAEFHDEGKNTYLRCVSSANRRYKGCGQRGPRLDSIISQIEQEILPKLAINANDIDSIRDELKGLMAKDYHVLEAEVQLIREQLIKIDSRLKGLLDIRLDGEITKDEYQAKKSEIELNKAKLTHKLEVNIVILSRCDEDIDQALALTSNLIEAWRNADDENKHDILQRLFVKFVIDNKKITDIEVKSPFNMFTKMLVLKE